MKNSKQDFPEGTWFAVPLRDGGYCRGLIARSDGKGRAFGYFFGPKVMAIEELPSFFDVRPSDAVLVGRFGDLGLLNGEWELIGKDTHWDRSAWPIPPFIRVNEETNTAMKATFNDNFELVSDEPCDPLLAKMHPKDSLMGYGFVEIMLTRLLSADAKEKRG